MSSCILDNPLIFQSFKIITLENCVLTILELNWNRRLGHKKTKLNICHRMLTSFTQLQNWSFHVVERTRTSTKCEKNEICTCKACKNTIFHCQICKFVGFFCRRRRGCLSSLIIGNRELKKQRRRRQQQRHKTMISLVKRS